MPHTPASTHPTPVHVAVALDGTGWHPGSWHRPDLRAESIYTARYWTDLVRQVEDSLLDFVTLEDSFGPPETPTARRTTRGGAPRGRLEAGVLAALVAARTSHVGIIPTITTSHTEPFHVSKNLATLDHISLGRAGWQVRVSPSAADAALVGRRSTPRYEDLLREATDVIDVVRRLWDSWEDDAEIRDAASGRFIDRDKVHYVDYEGSYFAVKGPSITPRPPQGQPVVTTLAHQDVDYDLAARGTDVVYVTPGDDDEAESILAAVRDAEDRVGRSGTPLLVMADIEVVLDTPQHTGVHRLLDLNDLAGQDHASDALIFAGRPDDLTDLIAGWQQLGYAGVRLRPAEHAIDLPVITTDLVPALRSRGLFRTSNEAPTLRRRLGLPTAVNRYAAAS